MVFAARYRQRRFEEARQEGRKEGRQQVQQEWEAWNQRRLQAKANGEPFDEAPPSQKQPNSDSNRKNP